MTEAVYNEDATKRYLIRKTWDEKSADTVPRKSMGIGSFFVYMDAHFTAASEKKRAVITENIAETVLPEGILPVIKYVGKYTVNRGAIPKYE